MIGADFTTNHVKDTQIQLLLFFSQLSTTGTCIWFMVCRRLKLVRNNDNNNDIDIDNYRNNDKDKYIDKDEDNEIKKIF